MAKETTADASIWDKIGDFFSAFGEGVGRFLTRLFGSSNERYTKGLGFVRPRGQADHKVTPGSLLHQINELEAQMEGLSDDELRGTAARLRERLAQGATLDSLIPEAFAATREAARRYKNMRHYDVQMLGGVVLHQGKIAEMVTGEGKTLVATLPAVLNALVGKGVHVITVNDYLARRDCEWMLPIYRGVGISAGYIQADMDPKLRREAYNADITYGTNSEFGFDYLRDNMKLARWGDNTYDAYYQQVQRAHHYAIIDEVDNILIDEARTPLIISGQAFSDVRRYDKANQIAVQLTELQKSAPGTYFEIKEKEHTCHLTDEGVRKAEELAGVESFYTQGNMEWPHLIDNALKAHHLYRRDKQYAVLPDPDAPGSKHIVIIDEFTGRLMHGRQWSDGLHQAVEAKHARDGVKIKEETQTLATVTLQNYFKMYKKLSGMTGTAMTEADEFWKIYKLEVIAIPTNKPLSRINHPDLIYLSDREKWKAVVDEVADVHKSGRPILIGTTDVDKSLKLSEMLKRKGIKHELLNALPEHAAREAEIVAQAGRLGAVTIATNMAGRGTDIILGGNPETLAWARLKDKYATRLDVPEAEWKTLVEEIEVKEKMKEQGRQVAEMGGLHIIGTERHESRRIDNQLRGRSGRQGDPGSSRFYLSLQDDLMRIFAGEWVAGVLTRLGMREGEAIESRMVSRRVEAAQKKVEERNFDIRKNLLEFDEVMDVQRKRVYGYRQKILEGTNCKLLTEKMLLDQVELAVERFLASDYGASCFAEFASNRLSTQMEASDFHRADFEQASAYALDKAFRAAGAAGQELIDNNLGAEEERDWNWKALVTAVNTRWNLKTTDGELKQVGKDGLHDHLEDLARKSLETIDLGDGKVFLEPDWGIKALADWMRLKYQIPVEVDELKGKKEDSLVKFLVGKLIALYRDKDVDFPVKAALQRFMNDKAPAGATPGQRYNREGLLAWARTRFPQAADRLNEEDFRTLPKSKLAELLLSISRSLYPTTEQEQITVKVAEALHGTKHSEAEDAAELVQWAKETFGLEIDPKELTGVTPDQAEQALHNAFDLAFRPEMRVMERSLLLGQLDASWKAHLLQMDQLRSNMNLMWVGQIDAKTEYKIQGNKEFESMWEGIADRVSEMVFRMEEMEGAQSSVWVISSARHDAAPKLQASKEQEANVEAATGAGGSEKKVEPIRNRGQKVGRNDPCPCGSGRKYKVCHGKNVQV
jgi:preprotein translocase subunit SecA